MLLAADLIMSTDDAIGMVSFVGNQTTVSHVRVDLVSGNQMQ